MNWNLKSRKCSVARAQAYLGGVAMALLAGVAVAQDCTPKIADDHLIKAGHLVMATSPTLPPMAYADQQGVLKGLRIELGYEIAKRLCLKPEYISTEYATMVPGLQGGRWDMINAGLFVTAERRKILFMIPYENLAISISTSVGASDPITKVDDLAGKTVSTDIGGYAERKIKELNEDFKKRGLAPMNINLFDNYATVYQALRAGQVEAAVSIDPVAKQYQDRGEFTHALSGMYPTPGSLSFGSKDVADAVSEAMKEMNADGTLQTLMGGYGVSIAPGDLAVLGPEG
ncbi:transporter substrate-binding domain-containing protein [Rhizobiaceae bacterium BDR2-2]|uniref:Transporter substrate-binding domain-containing protein n=1 Tax=Ectorhizobium quercum TaxID=2965071 RepID=A0AAE3MZI8_9HYPH|nr:transporter substrate-binding domain-containing protein [Ectorhizobium quercum]MCX8997186.1 transporter substrate-binding domain-containing protein [Ectorhizobium quercum]